MRTFGICSYCLEEWNKADAEKRKKLAKAMFRLNRALYTQDGKHIQCGSCGDLSDETLNLENV